MSFIYLSASKFLLSVSVSFYIEIFAKISTFIVILYIGLRFFLGKANQIISHSVNVTIPKTTLVHLFTSTLYFFDFI